MAAYVLRRQTPPFTSWLIATIGIVSIAAAVGGVEVYVQLALIPSEVWSGQLWRLVTWALVEPGPLVLILTCVAIYWFGGALRSTWGVSRFSRYLVAVVLIAGVGTCLIGLVSPTVWWFPQLGGMVVAKALVIAWALQFPERQIIVYWVLVVGGRQLAYGTLGVTLLSMVYFGIAPMLPELIACAVALLTMTRAPRRWWLRFKAYRAQRKLDAHRRRGRNGGPS